MYLLRYPQHNNFKKYTSSNQKLVTWINMNFNDCYNNDKLNELIHHKKINPISCKVEHLTNITQKKIKKFILESYLEENHIMEIDSVEERAYKEISNHMIALVNFEIFIVFKIGNKIKFMIISVICHPKTNLFQKKKYSCSYISRVCVPS
jgi:hypothetical protein